MIDAKWLWLIIPVSAILGALARGLAENGRD